MLHPATQPSLEETVTLEPDEVDDSVLLGKLLDAVQRLCRMLRSQRRACTHLSLTIRYSDQIEVTRQERLTRETCWEVDMSPHLYALFQRCFRRRVRLRLMTVNMTGVTAYAEQGSLFDEQPPDSQRKQARAKSLAVALDTLHTRFGEQAIRYGRSH